MLIKNIRMCIISVVPVSSFRTETGYSVYYKTYKNRIIFTFQSRITTEYQCCRNIALYFLDVIRIRNRYLDLMHENRILIANVEIVFLIYDFIF